MMSSHRKSFSLDKDKSMQIHRKIARSRVNKNDLKLDAVMRITRKPCLVLLTDVLKTETGRAYLDSRLRCWGSEKRGRATMRGAQSVSNGKRATQSCPERLGGRDARATGLGRKSARRLDQETLSTPKRNKERRPLCSRRLNIGSAGENNKDTEEVEVVIEEDIYTSAGDQSLDEQKNTEEELEVILDEHNGEDENTNMHTDHGLVVNSGPLRDPAGHVPSVHGTKWKDPEDEEFHGKKRKRESLKLNCNGRNTPRRSRESVLRLSGETNRADGRPGSNKRLCPEDSGGGGDGQSETPESRLVQITVEEAEGSLRSASSPRGGLELCPSPNNDNVVRTGHSEPIVLSSDEEEGGAECQRQRHSSAFYPPVCADNDPDAVRAKATQTQLTQEDMSTQELHLDEVVRVVIEDPNVVVPVLTEPHMPSPYSLLPFSALHCGGCRADANGDIMASDQRILIPLKDESGELEIMLTLEREELLQYSVWEMLDLFSMGLAFDDLEDKGLSSPAAFLFLYVSDTLAGAIGSEMRKLSVIPQGPFSTGNASPFLLLCLKDPLVSLKGTYMRSILDILCLNGQSGLADHGVGYMDKYQDIHAASLSLEDSLELVRRTGLDPHLLCLVGAEDMMEPEEGSVSLDWDVAAALNEESVPESEAGTAPPRDSKPDEDEKIAQKELSAEESPAEPPPVYTVCHRRNRGSYSVSLSKPDSSWTKYKHQGLARRLIQFPPPPSKGGITVTMEDLQCLDSGQFLNDVIIDFYLKYLIQNARAEVAERSHIFSSFFYKQLTRRDNASEDGGVVNSASSQRQRRHQRVKTWTRHVDIFNKDFLFVPVNQESHWYLVVICFPGLEAPRFEVQTSPASPKGVQDTTSAEPQAEEESNSVIEAATHGASLTESQDTRSGVCDAPDDPTKDPPPGPLNCTEKTCKRRTVCKRPCILIMDSLKISHHERVFKLVREYLQTEWEVRRGSSRDFGAEQVKSSHCRVPLQDNTSDCGLYLLQYVESFLEDPVVHFELPLYLQRWFSRQQVRRKRDEIRDLVLHLCRRQNLSQ